MWVLPTTQSVKVTSFSDVPSVVKYQNDKMSL